MERRPSRQDSDTELTGPIRAAVVAALARMVVAELEREQLRRAELVPAAAADNRNPATVSTRAASTTCA
jgi:hypothetical protein